MKLALVTRRYPPLIGGAEKVLCYLAAALAAEGADVSVVTARPCDLAPANPSSAHAYRPEHNAQPRHGHELGQNHEAIFPVGADLDLPEVEEIDVVGGEGRLRIFRLPSSARRMLGTWLYMRRLHAWFDRHPIDLAYVSMLKHDAYVAVEAGRRKRFPVVLRPEGAGATGDLAWQSWGRFGRRIGRQCRDADLVISISAAISAELADAHYDPARIVALPNGVPVPKVPWQSRRDWRTVPRAVFVGRLAPEKGLDRLIDAWPMVRARFPDGSIDPDRRRSRAARTWSGGSRDHDLADAVDPGRAACRPEPDPSRVGPVHPALTRGGDEHRAARGDGDGHATGRLSRSPAIAT